MCLLGRARGNIKVEIFTAKCIKPTSTLSRDKNLIYKIIIFTAAMQHKKWERY